MLNNITVVAVNPIWIQSDPQLNKRLMEKNQLCVGSLNLNIEGPVHTVMKNAQNSVMSDPEAKFISYSGNTFIQTHLLKAGNKRQLGKNEFILITIEHAVNTARCAIDFMDSSALENLRARDPSLRFEAYDLPPVAATELDQSDVLVAIRQYARDTNPDLYGKHADEFLGAGHIIVPLFAHVMSLTTDNAIRFPLKLKTLSDRIRSLLEEPESKTVRIQKIDKDHMSLWADAQGKKISFLDGGMASLPGIPGVDPIAIRVGIYSVVPGENNPHNREEWTLNNYVVGDMLEDQLPPGAPLGVFTERKRLQEAARYYVELFDALNHVSDNQSDVVFLHGPLINQFTMYDEGEPNYIPCLSKEFLKKHKITQEVVEEEISDVPEELWNQFMSIYGYTARKVFYHDTPVFGITERTTGKWMINAVLDALVSDDVVTSAYKNDVMNILKKYSISDDFLFGCILREGEYLSPQQVQKNIVRRARERWQSVVSQYPPTATTIIKTSEENFPFRVEANRAGESQDFNFFMRLIYHTARLLPRYAFPVGLDIADKYAKIPMWLSRGVSAKASALVLQKALRTGDKNTIMQVRQYLAHAPRDFFYRPKSGS